MHSKRHGNQGFTLIELMIVVVIVAILAAIAYPSYRQNVIETNRTEGKRELLRIAQQLERCYTQVNSYLNCVAFPVTSDEGNYQITASTLTQTTFTIEAAPQGGQTDDTECGTLSLSHTGAQGETGTGSVQDCW